ncbi:hypothetical protein OAS39_13685 [Pirellulales bacterium]|nr:hypothetical protein [Pirellulales bacterium]
MLTRIIVRTAVVKIIADIDMRVRAVSTRHALGLTAATDAAGGGGAAQSDCQRNKVSGNFAQIDRTHRGRLHIIVAVLYLVPPAARPPEL